MFTVATRKTDTELLRINTAIRSLSFICKEPLDPVVLKMRSLDQQHQIHLGICIVRNASFQVILMHPIGWESRFRTLGSYQKYHINNAHLPLPASYSISSLPSLKEASKVEHHIIFSPCFLDTCWCTYTTYYLPGRLMYVKIPFLVYGTHSLYDLPAVHVFCFVNFIHFLNRW